MGFKVDLGRGSTVSAFLKLQHEEIADLFARVLETSGKARAHAFYELRRRLSVHEAAEEEIIHPVARRVVPEGEAIVTQRLREARANTPASRRRELEQAGRCVQRDG